MAVEVAAIEKRAQGEVVPRPRLPELFTLKIVDPFGSINCK